MSSLRALQAFRNVSRLSRAMSTSTRAMRVVAPSVAPRVTSFGMRTFSVSARSFAAAAEQPVEKTLLQKIEDELNHEKEIMQGEEVPLPQSVGEFLEAGVWKIDQSSGQDEVVISRTYNNETIRVMFTISDVENAEPAFDEEAESSDDEGLGAAIFPIRCSISITKPTGGALSIEALAQDGLFTIETASFYKDAKLASDLTAESDYKRRGLYLGPQFENLDPSLQEGFESFLAERGIDENLALLIPEYAEWKEQKEYIDWLKGVKGFVAA